MTTPSADRQKKTGKRVLKSMFRRKSSGSPPQVDDTYLQLDVVEELIEEGSALLSERLCLNNSVKPRPWDGPFLCLSCNEKREAMEGKRP
ncbi:hypothetical protein Tco_1538012 [Tanacetum coccineum]